MIRTQESINHIQYEERTRKAVDQMEHVLKTLRTCIKCEEKYKPVENERYCQECISTPNTTY